MAPRARFGTTWWGHEWVEALENTASLDPNRLARGRASARNGSVGPLTINPGHVSARVSGTHHRYYQVDIAVRRLAASEWEQVADAIAARAGHAAALLDGELHPGIVDDARAADVRLLPGPGDLRPDCSCPDWAEPCKHASAVCYLVAAELDRDPFCLFLLRGMGREELLGLIRERRGGDGAERPAAERPPGLDPVDSWRGRVLDQPLDPLPALVAEHHHPTRPGTYAPWEASATRGRGPSVDLRGVDALAVDAVARAWSMIVDGRPSGLRLSRDADLARRAYASERPADLTTLSRRVGVTVDRLRTWADAWARAGAAGVAVVAEPASWSTDQSVLAAGRDQLVAMGYARRSVALNYDSLRLRDNVQLVVGPDGQWYKVQARGRQQDLHLLDGPADDLGDLVDAPAPADG